MMGETDGFIDPAPHTMQAVSITVAGVITQNYAIYKNRKFSVKNTDNNM